LIAEVIMVCPRNGESGLIQTQFSSLSGGNIFWALVLSELNLLLSLSSTKIYRKFKSVSLIGGMLWNIIIFFFFLMGTLIFIIKLRLSITF
jgi:hypothetical protein